MPEGIGIVQLIKSTAATENNIGGKYDGRMLSRNVSGGFKDSILIDPMTKETISKIAVLGDDGEPKIGRDGKTVYKVNDHWFRIDAQFIWKDAPEELTAKVNTPGGRGIFN